MGTVTKIARRTFLVGSVAVTGGLAFGFYAYKSPADNPLLDTLAEGEAALTPYVLINADGITLITPRADKGQGVYHVQAALIAEELDVRLDQIKADPGPPDPAYYNTALATEAVPFRSFDDSRGANAMRGIADGAMKMIGMQITGGSSSVPDSYEKLRIAGAVARETLKKMAAKKAGVAAKDLKTRDGAVILPDGTEITYTSLAPDAVGVTPVSNVKLRDPSEWRYLGKEMQRIDIVAKSTGTQAYGIDQVMDGMVYATVRRNPANGGGMKRFDASDAQTMRGVQKIVELPDGVGVVADNTWRAFRAADAISIDWSDPPYPASMEDHWAVMRNSITPENANSTPLNVGDPETALADETVTAEYKAPYLAHAPLEPLNALVKVTEERVDIWVGTQIPRFMQTNVAKITGHKPADIHVHVLMMGGSFGHRLEDDSVLHAVRIAREMKGTPVKMVYSREEDMSHDFLRQASVGQMTGAVKDGKVEAMDMHIAMPSVTDSMMGARQGVSMGELDPIILTGAWDQPYAIPNYRATGYKARGLAPVSSWRSVGASTNAFLHEGFLDELILEAGADPLEERIRLCSDAPSRKVLEAVGEMSGWGTPPGDGKGRGVAFSLSFGVPVAEVVEVTNTENGIRLDKVWVACDVGRVLDPINFDGLVKGGVVFGLGHAMNCEITFTDGQVDQPNFYAFEAMKFYQCPEIEVRALSNNTRIRGIGEPPVPPAGPALGNAIFAATGQRLREMPFNKFVDFA